MSSLRMAERTAHEEPKEETEVNVGPQMVESSTGETRKSDTIPPVVGCGEESAPETQEFTEPKVAHDVLERAPKPRGAVSRGRPQLHPLVKTISFLFISTVLWALLQVYQVSVTSLCSSHPLLCFGEPKVPPPWIDLLSTESDMFEYLLKDMVAGYSMSMDVKAAQMKITDLRTLIRASGRSQKSSLANDLSALLNEAKKSGKNLQTFATNIRQSFERITGTNDWVLQRIKLDTSPRPRVLGLPQTTVETSVTSDFEEAMDALDKSLEVIRTDVDSNSSDLRRIDKDLKAIVRSLRDTSDVQEPALMHPSKVDESPTNLKQLERCLQGLKDLQSYVDQATYVIGSAYSVIRDAKQQLEAIRGRLSWERGWSALDEKHIKAIAAGLENLEEKGVRAKSAQEEILTRKVQ